MKEEWRPIDGCNGKYEVSNLGRIKSLYVNRLIGTFLDIKKHGKTIFPWQKNVIVHLTEENKRRKFYVSRLVAFAFPEICGEYFEGAEVDHLDGDRTNNVATNLKWKTHTDNMRNPITRSRKINGKNSKPVIQYDLNGNFIREWPSIIECYRSGFTTVQKCVKGKRNHCGGYKWEYKEKGGE